MGEAAVEGAAWLGVARLEEAQVLRAAGIDVPILVLGYMHPERIQEAASCNATLTAYDCIWQENVLIRRSRQALPFRFTSRSTQACGGWVFSENGVQFFRNLLEMPGLEITGMFTHFPRIDEVSHPTTYIQLARFNKLITDLKAAGIYPGLIHASTSAGILYLPEARFDMVR